MLDLSHIDWRGTSHEGAALKVLRHDTETDDATVLIRMKPGCAYPPHRHVGVEEVFVLQGGYRDDRGEHRAGDYVVNDTDSRHCPVALEGEDCVMLAFAHAGIELIKSGV
jgi:putative transcriptional regulator